MRGRATAKDMNRPAQDSAGSQTKFRVFEGGNSPGKRLSLGEAAMKLPGMNGFGVERPTGLKQKMPREKEPEAERCPEQGRMYKNPNWWEHERMMM